MFHRWNLTCFYAWLPPQGLHVPQDHSVLEMKSNLFLLMIAPTGTTCSARPFTPLATRAPAKTTSPSVTASSPWGKRANHHTCAYPTTAIAVADPQFTKLSASFVKHAKLAWARAWCYNSSQQPRHFFASLVGTFPNFDCTENSDTARSRLYHPIILYGMPNLVQQLLWMDVRNGVGGGISSLNLISLKFMFQSTKSNVYKSRSQRSGS